MSLTKMIALVATFDTKSSEALYLKQLIEDRGHKVLMIDVSCLKEPPFTPDITSDEVARASGTVISEIRSMPAASEAIRIMTSGATKIVLELFNIGKISGLVSMGGGMGSALGTTVMRELPIGVPKLMVSTKIAQGGAEWYVGSKDVTLMPSVADIAGLNRITRRILANVAGAITGMVEATTAVEIPDKPHVLMSMLGITTECGLHVKSKLESEGYEVIVFHAIGPGGKALEEFVTNSDPTAVIELAINEVSNYLFGGLSSSGPERLTGAGKKGIPQIITCGCADILNFMGTNTIPKKYKRRQLYVHNPQASAVRLSVKESRIFGESIAEKLNRALGPVKVLISTRGFSSLSKENGILWDPKADNAFIRALRDKLRKEIEIEEVRANANDLRFAEAVIEAFHNVKQKEGRRD